MRKNCLKKKQKENTQSLCFSSDLFPAFPKKVKSLTFTNSIAIIGIEGKSVGSQFSKNCSPQKCKKTSKIGNSASKTPEQQTGYSRALSDLLVSRQI